MPEPKLAYRTARKVSEWTLGGYYSQVDVEGADNVPKDGPVIMCVEANIPRYKLTFRSAATHHNEIIDIATLGNPFHLNFRIVGADMDDL